MIARAALGTRAWQRGLVVVGVLLVAGCWAGEAGAPLPPAPPRVEVELADDDLAVARPVPAGRVVFRVRNAGEAVHRVTLIPLPEDAPPFEEMLADDVSRQVELVARVPDLDPGETGTFAVDLAEGQRYALMDFSETGDGTSHGRVGVAGEFRAGGQTSEDPSEPDTTGG